MNHTMLEHIMDVLPIVLEKNKNLFSSKVSNNNCYQKKKSFLKKNSRFLKSVRQEVLKKYGEDYSEEELFAMQKLYLLYPNTLPHKLLSLPWELIKIILNLYSADKRIFYTDLVLQFQWDCSTLEFYILNDLYEKYFSFVSGINDSQSFPNKKVISELLEIQTLLYEES